MIDLGNETYLQPYSDYQDSRIEWIGQVPKHWAVLPHRSIFREVVDRFHPDEPMLSVTIQRGVIEQRELLRDSSKKDSSNQDRSSYKLVEPGDIVYNKMRAWQGAIGMSTCRGIVSPAYIVMRPRQEQEPWYFHYLFRIPAFAKEAERWSYGITSDQWSLRPEDFKNIYSPVPPLEEQRAIARFLDRQDRRINRFIRAKRRLIELLNEQKQAIIHQAVTRGLDPDVPLKPSGIDWLGDIPAHWKVVPLKRVTALQYGASLPTPERREGTVRVYGSNGPVGLHDTANTLGPCIVVGRKGSFGKVNYSEEPVFAIDTAYFIDTGCTGQDLKWLYYILGWARLDDVSRDAAIPGLDRDEAYASLVLVPPRDEQRQIAGTLDVVLEKIETLSAEMSRELELMREYRTRLIADVVTGKLDVRNHPDAAETVTDDLPDDGSFEPLDDELLDELRDLDFEVPADEEEEVSYAHD